MAEVAREDPLREQLLDAAARVFARQGYDGTKIMDIVREAGLSTGAAYGRFRSKNELLRAAVVERAIRPRETPPAADHARVIDFVLQAARHTKGELRDADAVRLEAYVTARREPEVAAALAEAHDTWRDASNAVLAAAHRDGSLADDVDDEAVLFFVRVLNLGILLHRASGLPVPDDDAWGALLTRMLGTIGKPS